MTQLQQTPLISQSRYHNGYTRSANNAIKHASFGLGAVSVDQFSPHAGVRFGNTTTQLPPSLIPDINTAHSDSTLQTMLPDELKLSMAVASMLSVKNQSFEVRPIDYLRGVLTSASIAAKNLDTLLQVQDMIEAAEGDISAGLSQIDPTQRDGIMQLLQAGNDLQSLLPPGTDLNKVDPDNLKQLVISGLELLNQMSNTQQNPFAESSGETGGNPVTRLIKWFFNLIGSIFTGGRSQNLNKAQLAMLLSQSESIPQLPFSDSLRQLLTGFLSRNPNTKDQSTKDFLDFLSICNGVPGTPSEIQNAAALTRRVRSNFAQVREINRPRREKPPQPDPIRFKHELEDLHKRGVITPVQAQIIASLIYTLKEQGSPSSPDYIKIKTQLEEIFSLPWGNMSLGRLGSFRLPFEAQIQRAQDILDKSHYGMKEPKRAILRGLADQIYYQKLVASGQDANRPKPQITCLVGPPGVGKTSIGKAAAEALGTRFVRIPLSGLNAANIQGHQVTYIGAVVGRIIKAMREAGVDNPVILLDEVDKLSTSQYQGDPVDALLQVLDHEQNAGYEDNYLGIPYDLSKVTFICSGNDWGKIPDPLRDRMQPIDLEGYYPSEKIEIARKYIIPKIREEKNLDNAHLGLPESAPPAFDLSDDTLQAIIEQYAPDRGVRHLEQYIREIASNMLIERSLGRPLPDGRVLPEVKRANLSDFITSRKPYVTKPVPTEASPGHFNGMYYSDGPISGGTLGIACYVNARPTEGKEDKPGLYIDEKNMMGSMEKTMKESIQVAVNYIRTHAAELGIPADYLDKNHVDAFIQIGEMEAKDGPSAGGAITVAIINAIVCKAKGGSPAAPAQIAMTGTINMDGQVREIGGLGFKIQGARREGVRKIYAPEENRKDFDALPDDVKNNYRVIGGQPNPNLVQDPTDIQFVSHVKDVLRDMHLLS